MQIVHHRNPDSTLLGHGPASYRGFIMEKLSTTVPIARVVRERDCSVFEELGASVEFLVGPQQRDKARSEWRGQ